MKYLGIDYGEKRIGLAVSDAGGKIAFPRKFIFNRGNAHMPDQLKAILESESISRVVVGLPIGMDGQETEQTQKVREFVESLKKITSLPVDFENEMLTTQMAEKEGVKKEHVDESAAALILQSYLDKQNRI